MKKLFAIVLCIMISLVLFSSCGEKTVSEPEPESFAITYTDIYEANTYSALTSKHSTVYLKSYELTGSEFVAYDYYWSQSGYAFLTYPYTDESGNTVRDLNFITDKGSYLYLQPMTAEKASFDLLDYYAGGGTSTVESVCAFGLVAPEYGQTITECTKNDTGFEVTGENCDADFTASFYSAYFSEGDYAEGDKIRFTFELNEKNEMLKFENYYVFADGKEPVKTTYGEFVLDGGEEPDFMKTIHSILENDKKDIAVTVNTEEGVLERTVYSDLFLLYTECQVYSDEDYSELLTGDYGYYWFDTENDITLYLKTPAAE